MLFSQSVSSASMSRFWPGENFSRRTAGMFSILSNHDHGPSAGNRLGDLETNSRLQSRLILLHDHQDGLCGDRSIAHELNVWLIRDDAAFVTQLQQLTNGLTSVLTVVESPFVHIHTDKFVGLLHVKIPGKLH